MTEQHPGFDPARLHADLSRLGVGLPDREAPAPPDPLGLDRCTACGACLEACPEYGPGRDFVGPAVLPRVLRALEAAEGEEASRLLGAAIGRGGVHECGHSENCVEVCPERIPLVTAIQLLSRAVTKQFVIARFRR